MYPTTTRAIRTSTWLAIRRRAPFRVACEGPLDLILWMDAGSEMILGFEIAPAAAPYPAMERSLVAVMTTVQGAPGAIAFENPDDAAALRQVTRSLRIKVAPFDTSFSTKVHEAMQAVEAMRKSKEPARPARLNYLSKKEVKAADVAALCRASFQLWRCAPWERLSSDAAFMVTTGDACHYVMLMGAGGREFGLIICHDKEGVDIIRNRLPMVEYDYLYLAHVGPGEFSSSTIKLFREHACDLLEEDALPMVLRPKGPSRNPSAQDIRLATAVAEVVAAFDLGKSGSQTFKSTVGDMSLELYETELNPFRHGSFQNC